VWEQWSGSSIGEGAESEVRRDEILPTPDIIPASRYAYYTPGYVEDGSIVLRRVDPTLAEAILRGQLYPGQEVGSACPGEGGLPNVSFKFLIIEDGRSGEPIKERWYKLDGDPWRRAGQLDWNLKLVSTDV
jgi:hypothetical protein